MHVKEEDIVKKGKTTTVYAVSICPEFRNENTKTGILLTQKDCFFLLTESLKINLVSIYSSYELNPNAL